MHRNSHINDQLFIIHRECGYPRCLLVERHDQPSIYPVARHPIVLDEASSYYPGVFRALVLWKILNRKLQKGCKIDKKRPQPLQSH